MGDTDSTSEAKARLSEILRKVEHGKTARITRRGIPIAEIRALRSEPVTLERRIDELRERGAVTTPSVAARSCRPLASRRGALRRFLADRQG